MRAFISALILVLPFTLFCQTFQLNLNGSYRQSFAEQQDGFRAGVEAVFRIDCDKHLKLNQSDVGVFMGIGYGIQVEDRTGEEARVYEDYANIFSRFLIRANKNLFVGPTMDYEFLHRKEIDFSEEDYGADLGWFTLGLRMLILPTNNIRLYVEPWLGENNNGFGVGADLGVTYKFGR